MIQTVLQPDSASMERKHLWMLTAICLLSWCASMWAWPLWSTDELRYSKVAQELVDRDNWLYLTYKGKAYDEKPPLAFWMGAGLIDLTDEPDNVWVLRLPACLAALMTVLLTYLIGRDLAGARAAFVAALILICARLFNRQSMMVRLDMIYTAFTTLALWLWLHAVGRERMSLAQRIGFWVALAAACFTRNPLMPAVLLVTIGIDCLCLRSWRNYRLLSPLIGGLALLAFLGWWIVVQGWLYPQDVVQNLWHEQIINRFDSTVTHAKPIWYYVESLAIEGFGPWGLLLPFAIYHLRHREVAPDRRMWTLAGLSVGMFAFMSLVATKRPEYLLPTYPAMSILVGAYLVDMADAAARPQRWRAVASAAAWAGAICLAAVTLIGVIDPAWQPSLLAKLNEYHLTALAVCAAAFVALAVAVRRGNYREQALVCTLLGIVLVYAAYFHAFRAVLADE